MSSHDAATGAGGFRRVSAEEGRGTSTEYDPHHHYDRAFDA
jgi:hypothetical protein